MKLKYVLALLLSGAMLMGSIAFASEEDTPLIAPERTLAFVDVTKDAYYADAVNWAAEKGITTGKGYNRFDPGATVTRAEAVTFLWRLAGKPDPTMTGTFADVVNDPNKVWYETAVQWAVEKGVTNGTGSGFSPYVTCDRAMILTMLYRMEGKPWDKALAAQVPEEITNFDDLENGAIQTLVERVRIGHPFTDMEAGDYFEIPVLWAIVNGILDTNQVAKEAEAVGATTACVRGEMAYLLYRAAEYEKAADAEQTTNCMDQEETKMEYEIKGEPMPVVICWLQSGESLNCEAGSMSWMSPNMQMETSGGGAGKMFGRLFSGESMFQNKYTAQGGEGLIAFASSFPGSIRAVEIDPSHPVVVQKGGYLASETGVEMSVFFQKKGMAGFFGGEGFIMQKLSGNGVAFLEFDGSTVEYDIPAGQQIIVNTGNVAMIDATCSIDVQQVRGVKNVLFGGEGLFHTVITGPGRVVLQTMPLSGFVANIAPMLPTRSGN